MKALLFLVGVALVAGAIRRRRSPEQAKRDRGAYPYHNGPFA